MTLFVALVFLFVFGTGGGMVNALLVDRGLVLPRLDRLPDQTVLRLGFVGNMIVGGFAALMIGGLYGPISAVEIGGRAATMHLTFSSFAAAILTGAAGSRVFTQEIGKRYSRGIRKNLANAVKNTTEA
jgi:hypothetical protein